LRSESGHNWPVLAVCQIYFVLWGFGVCVGFGVYADKLWTMAANPGARIPRYSTCIVPRVCAPAESIFEHRTTPPSQPAARSKMSHLFTSFQVTILFGAGVCGTSLYSLLASFGGLGMTMDDLCILIWTSRTLEAIQCVAIVNFVTWPVIKVLQLENKVQFFHFFPLLLTLSTSSSFYPSCFYSFIFHF